MRPLEERHERTCQIVSLMIKKTCNNVGLMMVWGFLFIHGVVYEFYLIFKGFH